MCAAPVSRLRYRRRSAHRAAVRLTIGEPGKRLPLLQPSGSMGSVTDEDEALDRWRRADVLQEQMLTCSGWGLWQDLRRVEASGKVFHGNHHELKVATLIVDDPEQWLPLISTDNREGHARYLDNIDRLLHNYLAAAYSLSTCMYKVFQRRGWAARPEGAAYLSRTPIKQPGLPAFMFGLRHVAQHDRIPLTVSYDKGCRDGTGQMVMESYFAVSLDGLRLLDWSKSKESREGFKYLHGLSEDPRLDQLAPQFTTELLRFTLWFKSELRRVYASELGDLEALHRRHYDLMRPFYDANRPEAPSWP